jgi:two-component system, NtrC family, sensor histidine kinase HydH
MRSNLVRRIVVPVLAVSLILTALGGFSTAYMFLLMKKSTTELDELVETLALVRRWEHDLRQFRMHLKDYLLDGGHQHLDRVLELSDQVSPSSFADLYGSEMPPDIERWDATMLKTYRQFQEDLRRLAGSEGLTDLERQDGLRDLVDQVLSPQLIDPARPLVNEKEEGARLTSERIQVLARRMAVALLLLSLGGITAGALAGVGIARGISRSIVQLSIPIQDAAGKLNEVAGPFTLREGADFADLHEMLDRVKREVVVVVDRLRASEREVLRADQLASMGQLAAGLAHELRNPLMAIKLLAHSIGEQLPEASQATTDLRILQDEISRLEKLVTTFLDFARPPSLAPRAIRLQDELERVLELVRPRAEQQAARLTIHAPSEPLELMADGEQLRQVFLNLALNALDSIRPGGSVDIEVGRGGTEPGWLEIIFRDNGCGLPARLGERIFEPFVSTKETGTGLGLAICRRIVEAHGGALTAHNREGGGAEFRVLLPASLERSAAATQNSNSLPFTSPAKRAEDSLSSPASTTR